MTLDEAIKHAEEVAVEKKAQAWEAQLQEEYGKVKSCKECAEEHRQLAEWLKELKQLREQTRWIPCSERLPEPGEYYFVTKQYFGWNCTEYREIDIAKYDSDGWYKVDDISSITVLAWCELDVPKPWKGEQHGAD